jgi:hypothetical protein
MTAPGFSAHRRSNPGAADLLHPRPNGYITVDPDEIAFPASAEKKLKAHVDEVHLFDQDVDPQAKTLVIAYGVTARAARVAVAARESGRPAGFPAGAQDPVAGAGRLIAIRPPLTTGSWWWK